MRQEGTNGGRHDDGKRRAEREMHAHRLRHIQKPEDLVEDGHQHRAAADAEQAGQKTGDHTRYRKRRRKDHQL
ncbi:hypothetical protein D3C86_1638520 [compost metagenome]